MVKRIIILIASVIGAISTFLPWATSSVTGYGESLSESINGASGDGMFTLALFVIIAIVALIGIKKPLPTWGKIVITILAIICGVVAGFDIANASRLGIGTSTSMFGVTAGTSIGIGLILIPIMAAANLIVSWLPLDKKTDH